MSLRCLRSLVVAAVVLGTGVAHAETVTGTMRFMDGDGIPAPIANARVEVWRFRARPWIWTWGNDLVTTTDANGTFSATLPFVEPGVVTALRVFATNGAAQVFQQDFYTQPFFREPGLPGPEIKFTAGAATDVFDFSFTFSDAWATTHFNVADAIQRGKAYADARRDPSETDVIRRVDVLMNSVSTYYDPVVHAIRMTPGFAMDDFTVLHEYAHRLEEEIGSFYGIASWHDGCSFRLGAGGASIAEPGIAWMEGFADYYARAVGRAFGAAVDGPGLGTTSLARLESPFCPAPADPPDATEDIVAGALWDLADPAQDFSDELCGPTTSVDHETVLFQIFDRELDLGWVNPTIHQFTAAWIARGLDVPPALATMGNHGLALGSPAASVAYDFGPAANLAVWRPTGATWFPLGGVSGAPSFGASSDAPVPADYDGDGLTDLAVWDRFTGNWRVRLSASGGLVQTRQWGLDGDVPKPGDFDGDGEADFAVYRPLTGWFHIHNDSCGPARSVFLGFGPQHPLVGDFDGDGRDEPALYNPATGWVVVIRLDLPWFGFYVGAGGGQAVTGDFDGDGRADVAVFREPTGMWDIRRSSTGVVASQWWGEPGDVAVPADYDGDGIDDVATWNRLSGTWWILEFDGPQWSVVWGALGDIPVPAR